MGTVIISAAIILGGTFAAMYPSGVLSLLQIATIYLNRVLFICARRFAAIHSGDGKNVWASKVAIYEGRAGVDARSFVI